jgi:hypothetical protein
MPFFHIKQHTFIVCFCDLRPEDSSDHQKCYGQNALVLTKKWGIEQNISPVRYVHQTSPGVTDDYIELKNLYRSVRKLSSDDPSKALLHYLVHCLLEQSGNLIQGDLELTIAVDGKVRDVAQEAQSKIKGLLTKAATIGIQHEVIDVLDLLMDKIYLLHNELEKRDSYMRAYLEDFTSPATGEIIKDKVLYDEHEWRSIKFLNLTETLSDKKIYTEAVGQGFLPPKYNLRFTDKDVVAIIAQDLPAKEILAKAIRNGETMLSPAMESKVYLSGQFSE